MKPVMEEAIRSTIAAIHAGPHGLALVLAGGGSAALEWLLAVPGASATVLEALVPYSRAAMAAFLGEEPEKATGLETAAAMAERAYDRARRWQSDPDRPALGVAC